MKAPFFLLLLLCESADPAGPGGGSLAKKWIGAASLAFYFISYLNRAVVLSGFDKKSIPAGICGTLEGPSPVPPESHKCLLGYFLIAYDF